MFHNQIDPTEKFFLQEVSPIPLMGIRSVEGKQVFTFNINTSRSDLASLVWEIGGREYPIVTITSKEEIIHIETSYLKTDFESGQRLLGFQNRRFFLPSPDDFVSRAIVSVASLEPFALQAEKDWGLKTS